MLKLQMWWCFIGVILLYLIAPINSFYFGRNPKQSTSHNNQRQSRQGRTYDEIAKVINPNPYSNIGGVPYPAQPFWTYAGR